MRRTAAIGTIATIALSAFCGNAVAVTFSGRCSNVTASMSLTEADDAGSLFLVVRSTRCDIRHSRLVVYLPNGQRHEMRLGTVHSGTGRSWRLSFGDTIRDAAVQLRDETGRGPDVVVGSIPLPATSTGTTSESLTIVVAGLGLIGTIAGVWLTAWFASQREKRDQALAWNEQIFQKYEPAYRHFLGTWDGSANSALLKQAFDRLKREAIVPLPLTLEANRVHDVLAQTGGSSDAGKNQARKLYESFNHLLTDPLGFLAAGSRAGIRQRYFARSRR